MNTVNLNVYSGTGTTNSIWQTLFLGNTHKSKYIQSFWLPCVILKIMTPNHFLEPTSLAIFLPKETQFWQFRTTNSESQRDGFNSPEVVWHKRRQHSRKSCRSAFVQSVWLCNNQCLEHEGCSLKGSTNTLLKQRSMQGLPYYVIIRHRHACWVQTTA